MEDTSKVCTKCGELKDISEFHRNKRFKTTGINSQCKECINTRNREYRLDNIDTVKAARRRYYQENIDKMRAEKVAYYAEHREEKRAYDIEYREDNKDRILDYKREWEKARSRDPIFMIKRNLRRRIHHVLKGNLKADKAFSLLGCNAEEFKSHIESQFIDDMSWENYGVDGWHIDHIKPCHKFDLSDPEQQRQCFHYSNTRPLWAKDNLSRTKEDYAAAA